MIGQILVTGIGLIFIHVIFYLHLIFTCFSVDIISLFCLSRNRCIYPAFSSVLKAALRDSFSFLLEMLCSEFIWWLCGSECGVTRSGLNFLSLCGCWGLWRPAKTLLFVCMYQALICYSIYLFILFCKLSPGFAFFPTPVGSACSQPKTISTTNQIPCYSQANNWVVCITKKHSVLQQIVCG